MEYNLREPLEKEWWFVCLNGRVLWKTKERSKSEPVGELKLVVSSSSVDGK